MKTPSSNSLPTHNGPSSLKSNVLAHSQNGAKTTIASTLPPLPRNFRWQESEAIMLFVERVQRLNPEFTLETREIGPIVQICHAVRGLPLAIEMIAAWSTLFSCTEIAKKLAETEDGKENELLTSPFSDQAKRHQTLQMVFDDSWALLSEKAQWALAQLSIFGDQFTMLAAKTIADIALSDLMQLRNHSLLQNDADGIYSLHPLVKQFAVQRWQHFRQQEPRRHSLLRQAHSDYYLQQLIMLKESAHGEEELEALYKLQNNHQEIARGWQWATKQNSFQQPQESLIGLFRYLELTNQATEGKVLFGMVLAESENVVTLWAQVAQCHFLRRLAEHDLARGYLEDLMAKILPIVRMKAELKEEKSVAQDVITPISTYIFALSVLGWVTYEQGAHEAAHNCFSAAYQQAKEIDDHAYLMETRNGLGAVAFSKKEYSIATKYYRSALAYAELRNDLHYKAIVLGNLAALAQATNAYEEAEHYLQMRLRIDQRTQNVRQMAVSCQRLGQLALFRESYTQAEAHLRKSLTHFEQLGNSPEIAHVLLDLSKSLLRQEQTGQAEVQCLRSLELALHTQMAPRILAALTLMAEIWIVEGKKKKAIQLVQIVNSSRQIPVATKKMAQKLQATLVADLGEQTVMATNNTGSLESLYKFGLHLLEEEAIYLHPYLEGYLEGQVREKFVKTLDRAIL